MTPIEYGALGASGLFSVLSTLFIYFKVKPQGSNIVASLATEQAKLVAQLEAAVNQSHSKLADIQPETASRLDSIEQHLKALVDRGSDYEVKRQIAFDACSYAEQQAHTMQNKRHGPKWTFMDKKDAAADYAERHCKTQGLSASRDELVMLIEAALGTER